MSLIQTLMGNKDAMNIVMKALGSMMRGESPVDFMKNLAKTNPIFQGYDYDNLDATVDKVCKEKNADRESISAEITDFAKSYIK